MRNQHHWSWKWNHLVAGIRDTCSKVEGARELLQRGHQMDENPVHNTCSNARLVEGARVLLGVGLVVGEGNEVDERANTVHNAVLLLGQATLLHIPSEPVAEHAVHHDAWRGGMLSLIHI